MKLFGNDRDGAHKAQPQIETVEIRSDELTEQTAQTPEETKPKKKRRLAYVLGAIVLALAALAVAYAIWERPPELPAPVAPTETPAAQPQDKPEDPVEPVEPVETPDPGEAPAVPMSAERRDGVYTVLLVGRDFASNSTDTILVGTFDTVAHTLDFVSLPRDTLINIKWSGTPKKLNAVFPGYVNSGLSGIDGLKSQVKNLLGYDVDCYAVVTLDAVVQAVDAIGGVWFDVPQDMYYYDFSQDLVIEIAKGYQLLDGQNTLNLCRFRDDYGNGDLDRIAVQQALLSALAKQMLSLGNIPNLTTLIDILVKNLETDLDAANIAWLARQFLQCSMENINFHTAPIGTTAYINGVSFVSLNSNEWLTLVNERLNPFKTPLGLENVNLLQCNASGTSVTATNGMIAGGDDSFYCLSCTVKNGGSVVHHLPGACPKEEVPEEPTEPEDPEEPGETEDPGEVTQPGTQEEPGESTEAPSVEDPAAPEETPEIVVITPEDAAA